MYNASETLLMMRLVAVARAHGTPEATELAEQADAVLLGQAQARANMADSAKTRAGTGRKGAPRLLYIVEAAPGWEGTVSGLDAAVKLVNDELTSHKLPLVSVGTVRVTLSRAKEWSRMVDTDDGTIVYSIRKAKETGTNVASAQNEHESGTNPELGTTERKRRSRK